MNMNDPLQSLTKSIGRMALCAVLTAIPVSLIAQESTGEDGDVFELSPFEVSTEGTIGYLANNTLAGTRINSQLQDIANSIQVVTKEFLDDTGATSYDELLTFTTSTEVGGIGGNATLDQLDSQTQRDEFSKREPQFYTRVRGLATLDLARDYFLSDVAMDTYNTSQVTINRGPNAALFGLGSPGGISNAAMDRAMTDRSFGEINFRTEEYGSLRASLNYNLAAIEDKLAVRVAALRNDQRYEQNQAEYLDERFYIAATARPGLGITIRANYETGDSFGNRPVTRLATDRITPWIENGKPSYNPLTRQWFVDGELVTDSAYAAQLNASSTQYGTQAVNGNPAIIFDDPNSPVPGNNGYAVIQPGLRGNATGRTSTSLPVTGDVFMRQFQGWRALFQRNPDYIVGARPDVPNSHMTYYSDLQLTDFDVYNPRDYSLTGASEWQAQNFEVYSIRADKTFLNNSLGIELAYQDQYWESDHMVNMSASSGGNLAVDINTVLLDGSPNPNYGRPMIAGRGFAQGRIREREAFQAIGFAKYDFTEKHDGWLKHLGNHVLTAVYQDQTNNQLQPNRMNARATNDYNSSIGRGSAGFDDAYLNTAQGVTRATLVQYLGPSLVNINSIQEAQIQGVSVPHFYQSTDNALRWNPSTASFERGSVDFWTNTDNPDQVWMFGNPRNMDEIQSLSTVLQSQFLGGHVVSTLTWRRDSVKTFVGNGAETRNPNTGLYSGSDILLGDPIYDGTEDQTGYGVVTHVPDRWMPGGLGLSFHYVDSQNFAAGTAGVDFFNRPAPLQSGATEEYGFSLSALEGRFYARVNFYETNQDWEAISGVLPQIGNDITLVMENNTPEALAAAGWNLYDGSVFDPGTITAINVRPVDPSVPNNQTDWVADNIAGTATNYYQNTSSEGMEIEISYSPTSNWRVALNISEAESSVSNVMPIAGPELTRIANEVYLDSRFRNLFIVPDPTLLPDGTYENQDTLGSRADNLLGAIALRKANENGPLQEIRKWRWNLITNYTFKGDKWDDTWLSGFAVGAAVRWQDEIAIGAALKEVDGSVVPDYDNQYFGPTETNVDTWITYNTKVMNDKNLQIQFRIRNLTSGDGGIIPVKANPDGEVALWRLGAPITFELSARLSF